MPLGRGRGGGGGSRAPCIDPAPSPASQLSREPCVKTSNSAARKDLLGKSRAGDVRIWRVLFRAAGGREKSADAQREERLHQPYGNVAWPPGPARQLGRAPPGTARCRQRGADCGKGKLSQSQRPFVTAKAADANGSTAGPSWEPEGAGSFRLAQPCALGQWGKPPSWFPRCYFPFLFPLLIFWSFPNQGGVLGERPEEGCGSCPGKRCSQSTEGKLRQRNAAVPDP